MVDRFLYFHHKCIIMIWQRFPWLISTATEYKFDYENLSRAQSTYLRLVPNKDLGFLLLVIANSKMVPTVGFRGHG